MRSRRAVTAASAVTTVTTVTTDAARFDLDTIWRWLRSTEWAAGIPRALVERSIRGALCFGILAGRRQLAFARVITDRATFAYVADVFVDESARGRGLALRLMKAIVAHRELRGLRRWMLATRDAHGLYAKVGFRPMAHPQWFMEIHRPRLYVRAKRNAVQLDHRPARANKRKVANDRAATLARA